MHLAAAKALDKSHFRSTLQFSLVAGLLVKKEELPFSLTFMRKEDNDGKAAITCMYMSCIVSSKK